MSFERAIRAGSPLQFAERPPAGQRLAWLAAMILAVAAAIEQARIGLDTDVSWLLTVGEHVLGGARLYVDIVEVNPPASVLIYLPGIAVAHALGLTPEFATAALTFLAAAASALFAGWILAKAEILHPEMRGPVALSASFALLLLPGLCFAQREHVALLTLLPFIAVIAARVEKHRVSAWTSLVAGCGAGVTMAIKPHFVLAVAPLLLLLAWRRRSVAAALRVETWSAAAAVLAYLAYVAAVYPDYFTQVLPLVKLAYMPVRLASWELWTSPAALLFVLTCGLSICVGGRRLSQSFAAFPLLASLGFAAALWVQGKGYPNHFYPAIALAFLSLCWLLAERGRAGPPTLLGLAGCLLLSGTSLVLFDFALKEPYSHVAQLVRRVARPHPRIIVAGSNLSIGHPLTRWVGGTWVGTRGSLWASATARELLGNTADPRRRAELQAAISEDRRLWVADVERNRPDVILEDDGGRKWAARNGDVRQAMAPYRAVGSVEGIIVMVRASAEQSKSGVKGQTNQAQGR